MYSSPHGSFNLSLRQTVGCFSDNRLVFLSYLFAESRFQNDANQPDWFFEWEKC